jgi:hypothetical protein
LPQEEDLEAALSFYDPHDPHDHHTDHHEKELPSHAPLREAPVHELPSRTVDASVAEAIREALAAAGHHAESTQPTQPVKPAPRYTPEAASPFPERPREVVKPEPSATADGDAVHEDELFEVTATNHGALRRPEPERTLVSDVFPRLPSCELALEAGRAVSECLFNRADISDFASELSGPLGRLVTALGADWDALRSEHDLDAWVIRTDQLLQALPERGRKIEDWYKLGFELATLHNLAGQLTLDGSDEASEQRWRGALERFLVRAERAEIGYENLGRVLGLLENLAGPTHERDLTNIGRSLQELRRHAVGADEIHTAA